jgi:uncharacterized membrane protein YsdA (DUF1294 family)
VIPGLLLTWLVAINLVTFGAYAWDKAQAKRMGTRRIRERTLWILCLAGGVLGAWIAFFALRHKTRHQSFWAVQIAATVLWTVVLGAVILR